MSQSGYDLDEIKLFILRLSEEDEEKLEYRPNGTQKFTLAFPHNVLKGVTANSICIVLSQSQNHTFRIGHIRAKQPITSIESRLNIRNALLAKISFNDIISQLSARLQIPDSESFATNIRAPGKKTQHAILNALLRTDVTSLLIKDNLRHISRPKLYISKKSLQINAIETAMQIFGISKNSDAVAVSIIDRDETGLDSVSLLEDNVIEHDARCIEGMDLIKSDMTGMAVFERGRERLQVFTANRRPLEKVLGIDLIYYNQTNGSIVMLQYKMLEKSGSQSQNEARRFDDPFQDDESDSVDWIYRPDNQLESEIDRMMRFNCDQKSGEYEYRLSPHVYYLKFVKRTGSTAGASFIMSLEHYLKYRTSPAARGSRDGIRVSYDSLEGQYLRGSSFAELVRSGYIGSYNETTGHFLTIIKHLVQNDGIVAAIQSHPGNFVDDYR